jgi:MarR family transcriptional regulator, negative regulator of the multidrug operon emrRAB
LTTNSDELSNRLGALALRLGDQLEAAVTDAGARSLSAATALSALDRFLDAPTVSQLSAVLGLSSSATVRVVDGLVSEGHVTRRFGADGRTSPIRLTASGRRVAKRIVGARVELLSRALSSLDEHEKSTLAALVDRVLIELVNVDSTKGWMCRLCDTQACGAARGEPCPITKTALDL